MKSKLVFSIPALFILLTSAAHANTVYGYGGVTLTCDMEGSTILAYISAGSNTQSVIAEACANSTCSSNPGTTFAQASVGFQPQFETGVCYFTWTLTNGTTGSETVYPS